MITRVLAVLVTLAVLALAAAPTVQAQSATDLMKKGAGMAQPLDLNTAPVADLKKLPGIGDSGAQKIIASRPFTKTSDLVDKNILSAAAFEKIKGLVTVGPK